MVHTSHPVSLRKAAFHKDEQKVVCVEMDSNLEMKHLHTALLSDNLPSKQSAPAQRDQHNYENTNEKITQKVQKKSQGGEPQQLFTAQPISKQVSKTKVAKQWFSGLFTKSVIVKNLSVFNPIVEGSVESSYDSTTTHQPGDVLNIVTSLDTGGQPQYIHLRFTVNIYPTVNFVIHDLTKSLDDQVLVEYSEHRKHTFHPYHLNFTNLDMIKLLMSNTNNCLEMPSQAPGYDKNSFLCFVGTHADKVRTNKIIKALIKKTDCKALILLNEGVNILFPVDTTTAGDKRIEDPNKDVYDVYELPIMWMLLELEIQQVCTNSKKLHVLFTECVALAKAIHLMSNPEEVKNALIYHHLLGVLIFFQEISGLRDYVIIDHQWWFDTLSNIISFSFRKDNDCHGVVHRLKYKGILCREILQKVEWEGDINEEYFLLLLSYSKIIAPLHTKSNQKDEFFIPCILLAFAVQQRDTILQRYGDLQVEPLLMQFKSGILPRGLFCCLAVHLLQSPPLEWQPHFIKDNDYHVFINLITFTLPNVFSLSHLDTVSHLEIQIRHKVIKFATTADTTVHLDVYHKILEALLRMCDQLNFSFEKVQDGFFCQCGKSFEHHVAIVSSGTTTSKLFATCSANSVNQSQLAPCHLVRFDDGVTSKLGKTGIIDLKH